MYKIVIIEDEPFIRNALIHQINWGELGCVVAGEADNGRDGIEVINNLSPDIVISDIKMDGPDGIAISRYILEHLFETKVILITGFAQMDYAQAAIKIGVNDFILKPIDPEELIGAVKKAITDIEQKKKRKEEMLNLRSIVQESMPILRERFFQELSVNMLFDTEEIVDRAAFLDINLNQYAGMILEIDKERDVFDASEQELQPYLLGIKKLIKPLVDGVGGYVFEMDKNICIIADPAMFGALFELASQMQAAIDKKFGLSVSVGISERWHDICKLNQCIDEARYALRHKFYLGSGSVIYSGDVDDHDKKKADHITFINRYVNIVNYVKVGDGENAREHFERLWAEIAEGYHESFIRNKAFEFVIFLFERLDDNSVKVDDIMPLNEIYISLSKFSTVNSIYRFIKNIIFFACKERNKYIHEKNSNVIKTVLNYIKEHYNHDVSLETLSKLVYLNPKYLSTLFKKETGETISNHIAHIRIEKAKELMSDIRLKTYEIADKVGIHDSRYFSQLFKRHTGLTPSQYRDNCIL